MSLHLVTGYAGKAHIKAADHGTYNAAVVGNGRYVLDSGNMFSAMAISANKIRIYDGLLLNQGRHIQIDPNTYEEVDIENGSQGYMRNDLICMRYAKDVETDIESVSLVVIKGTPTEASPVDPEYTQGDILNGAIVDDVPLYRVPLDGLTVGELVPLFDIKPSLDNMIVSDLDEMSAITEAGKYVADAKAVGEIKSNLSTVNVHTFSQTITTSGWRDLGTITLEKGVYVISVGYNFGANATGVRGVYLANNKGWNGHYIYDLVNATGGSNRTQRVLSSVVGTLEETIVTVKALQSSGGDLSAEVIVDVVKLA